MKATRKKALSFVKRNAIKIGIVIAIFLLSSLILGVSAQTLLTVIVFIALASFSTFYFNYVSAPINFELVKLFTILTAYNYGMAAGLTVGILSTIIGKVLIGRIDEKLPISVAAISVVAVLAAIFSTADIVVLGIILVGLYNISLLAISLGTGGDIGWNVPYEGSNFVINFILFTRIAPFLVA